MLSISLHLGVITLIEKFRQLLYDHRVRGVNVDDNELLVIHKKILREKPLLHSAFNTFYQDMSKLCDEFLNADGSEIELGTGSGFFKSIRPSLVTSDVRKAPYIDLELDAQNMKLEDNSVRVFFAVNVFHHISNPHKFFAEIIRVLNSGGGCILIEPHGGFASSIIHTYLHSDEHFDKDASDWITEKIRGPLSGANQALAHIVFKRDIKKFIELYGDKLRVVYCGYEKNALRYLFSGGLNFRQLLPSFMNKPLIFLERLLGPLCKHWSLHQVIVLRKL